MIIKLSWQIIFNLFKLFIDTAQESAVAKDMISVTSFLIIIVSMDGGSDRPMDGWTNPIIEMRGCI